MKRFAARCACAVVSSSLLRREALLVMTSRRCAASLSSQPLAVQLYSLREAHVRAGRQRDSSDTARLCERKVWELLESVDSDSYEERSDDELAEILASYVYFSLWWENGLRGPASPSQATSAVNEGAAMPDEGPAESSSSSLNDLNIPVLKLETSSNRGLPSSARGVADEPQPVRRSSPLDTIIDF